MTSTEKAKAIRAALKEAGFTSRQVSVRHRYVGYSSSFNITIKDGNISEMQVKNICKRFESYETDERTGEILEGGNDYILVERDNHAPVDGSEYLDAVKNALAKLEREGQGEKIEGTRWTIFKQQCCFLGNCQALEKCCFLGNCQALEKLNWDVSRFRCPEWDGVAESIAEAIKAKELDAAYLARKSA